MPFIWWVGVGGGVDGGVYFRVKKVIFGTFPKLVCSCTGSVRAFLLTYNVNFWLYNQLSIALLK